VAAALAEAGAPDAALRFLTEALARTPDDAALLTQRGQFGKALGDLPGAEEDLTARRRLSPAEAEAYRAYANGRKSAADDQVAERSGPRDWRARTCPAASRRIMRFAAAKFAADRGDGRPRSTIWPAPTG
jgi:tetratricopeptide (TPR) repeat protein